MTINVAINGYGRIGRNIVRALYESQFTNHMRLVAINDLAAVATSAHLTKYDSTHGIFNCDVDHRDNHLIIDGDEISLVSERDPLALPWEDLNIDIVLECTGKFTSHEQAKKHINAGAKKVLVSAPGKEMDATVVYGVNHHTLKPSDQIVSNASCTTNCLAPLVKPLHHALTIQSGLMNTVHAYTNDQVLLDSRHKDLRRARAAAHAIIPTKTGAAAVVGLVIPELMGKLDGFATRVPTMNVSMIDVTLQVEKSTTPEVINRIVAEAAETGTPGVLAINELPLVSSDFNHHPASCIFDATQTRTNGKLVKVIAWYDNEWGFSNRMLDTAKAMFTAA